MRMNVRRILAAVMAFVLVLGMLPAGAVTAHAAELTFKVAVDGQDAVLTDGGTERCEESGEDVAVWKVTVPAGAKTLTVSRASQTETLGTIYADEVTELENDGKTASIDLAAGYRYLCFCVENAEDFQDYHLYLEYQEGGEATPPETTEPEETSVPFGVTVGGTAVTDIAQSTLSWAKWDGTTADVTCYTVTVPQGSTEATLTFTEGKQWTYYTSTGVYIGQGDTSWTTSTTHTVAIQDSNGDGELDGVSVQKPDAFDADFFIQFVYGTAGGGEGGETPEPTQCLYVLSDAPATGTITAGALYELELNKVFADSEGHEVSYSFESTVSNQHTKIKDGWFCFSTNEPGTYEVKLTATCGEASVSRMVTITAEKASDGIEEQYSYDETAKSSVTVYVTISNDGYPISAVDGTVMANLKVTVPYFDLGLYGLEDYYRYGTASGTGPYTNTTIIQRPTGLHLYLYLLERYYMGLDESKCCLGTSGVLEYADETLVNYMNGDAAYDSEGKRALMTSGGPTSIYMVNFWGHDENLMYFRNHCYPLMGPGWGSTSDYILLSDGDAWDVGMFSNWSFNRTGKFTCFDKNVYNAEPGASVSVSTLSWGTTSAATKFETVTGLDIGLYNSDWELIKELPYTSGNTITFAAPETAGTYYLLGLDDDMMDAQYADTAPAAARLVVGTAGSEEPIDVSRILLNTYETTLVYNRDESKTAQLTATVLPAEATGWTIAWTSDNEAVATVDQNGLVTGLSEGTAVITAAIGEVKAQCTVKVEKYNTAPTVVSGAADHTKVKTGEAVELDVASLFTDEQGDALTYTVEICQPSGLTGSWEYAYAAVEGFDTTVTDGKYTVTFPEIGIYAIKATASDGKLTASHTYQVTVVDNDAGVIKLNDGIIMDLYNVVAVDASVEFVEDYEIPYKGTHDTYVHHIVLSKDTVSGGPNRKMDVSVAEGYTWGQYGAGGVETEFSTRADIGVFASAPGESATAHFLQFHTECATHTDENKDIRCDVCTMDLSCDTCVDENKDKTCDVCGKWLNNAPTLIEGVTDQTVKIQTGLAYQLDDLMNGKIFEDIDGDSLIYSNYSYRKSADGGETWGDWNTFQQMEHGTVNSTLSNSAEGTYLYEFKANDGFEDSVDRWYLTLLVMDVVPADISFYLGRDQNYSTNGSILPVLELYRTAGIDENQYDYVGWFEKDGKTVYVYNPADYEIIDGETDYVVIDGVNYELHDYEKIAFTNSAFNDADESATPSNTVVSNYNMFYVTVTTGRYSTRVYGYNTETSAYDVYLGGQSMELPREQDIYGGGGDDLYLRQVSVYTTSKKLDNTYFTVDDYYAEVIMPITGSMIHSGTPYVDGNYAKFPFFMWAAGNGSLYNAYVYPYDTDNYIFSQQINLTTSKGTSVVNKTISIGTIIPLKVTVPETAEFELYFQYNNFNTKEMEPIGEAVLNGDGTKTLSFKVSKSSSNYTWRLTDTTGKYVTRAGWLAGITAATEKNYTFDETSPTDKKTHSFRGLGTTVASRDEADLQVFMSATGFKGGVTETTRIRAYRMWQIINSDPGNIMVEPDFNIQVLQGNPADINLVSGGNVKNNWIDVTPTTTDIVAVNYDALEVLTTADVYGTHGGLFPATNPERTNVFIITNETAGTAVAHIPFNGSKETDRGTEWDYNYDTWFYMKGEEKSLLDFTVTGTGTVDVSYATVITDASLKSTLSGWTSLSAEEGTYYVDLKAFPDAGTKGGTVIIKMTDSTGTSYALVRVAEMTATVTNVTTPGEPLTPGDQVSITFDGLYRSINKISGIFNPTTYYLRYTSGGAETNGALGQYQQMDKASLTLTIPEDIAFPEGAETVDFAFTNGYVYGSMYAASSPFQSMYYITDTGVGTNFSAVGVSFVLSRLADIPITVEQKTYYDVKVVLSDGENVITNATFSITDPNGNALTPDEDGIYQDLTFGDYYMDIAAPGYRRNIASLHLGSADAENVVDGILVKTVVLEKGGEGCWDGTSVSEPKTDENGVYLIGTGAELAWFAQTVNAGTTGISGILTADIDLANYDWTSIGNQSTIFTGNLDGQNHKITGLYIYSTTGATYTGLFGSTGSSTTISNLTVEGNIYSTSPNSISQGRIGGVSGNANGTKFVNVHTDVDITIDRVKGTWAYVGGISGSGGTFTNCSNSGDISGYNNVGGLCGGSASSFTACFNSGNISGNQYLGGIASAGSYGAIVACYNTGDITGKSTYIGGITGEHSAVLTNCFNTGTISVAGNTGAIIGRIGNGNVAMTDNYYLQYSHNNGFGGGNQPHQVATMVTAETLASVEFVATINNGLETPAYKWGGEHPILVWEEDIPATVAISADKETMVAGETVTVTLTLDRPIANVALAEFFIHYDTSLFTRGEATVGTAITGTSVSDKNVAVDGTELKNDGTDAAVQKFSVNTFAYPDGAAASAGTVVTVTFTAKEDIEADAMAEFKVEFNMMQDKDLVDIAVETSAPVSVSVIAKEIVDDPAPEGIIRVKGKTRYDTGIAVANYLKEVMGVEQFEAVVIANGENFPDALAGSYLAHKKNAPILLTNKNQDANVLAYIEANLVSGGKVYILGGTAAVSQEFEDGLVAKGIDYARVKGATRYETNLEILKEAGVTADQKILIATGNNYADSLSASATGLPMVLVGKGLTDAQKAFLETTSKNFVILGGEGAVSAEIEAELAAMGNVERVKGKTRYETSVEIAKYFFTAPESAVLGYANNFPDGLCAGPLAIALKAPLILTADGKTAAADAYIENITSGVVTGGEARISDDSVREIFELAEDAVIEVK